MLLKRKLKFHELVARAKNGDRKAFIQLVGQLNPAIKKYSHWSRHYNECYSDLIFWLMNAIHKYPA